jgi:hypothetical protein
MFEILTALTVTVTSGSLVAIDLRSWSSLLPPTSVRNFLFYFSFWIVMAARSSATFITSFNTARQRLSDVSNFLRKGSFYSACASQWPVPPRQCVPTYVLLWVPARAIWELPQARNTKRGKWILITPGPWRADLAVLISAAILYISHTCVHFVSAHLRSYLVLSDWRNCFNPQKANKTESTFSVHCFQIYEKASLYERFSGFVRLFFYVGK